MDVQRQTVYNYSGLVKDKPEIRLLAFNSCSADSLPGATVTKDISRQEAKQVLGQLIAHYDQLRSPDKLDLTTSPACQQIYQYARELGKGSDFFNQVFQAAYRENRDMEDPTILMKVSKRIGLDLKQVTRILATESSTSQEKQECSKLELADLSTLLINDDQLILEVKSADYLNQMLETVRDT